MKTTKLNIKPFRSTTEAKPGGVKPLDPKPVVQPIRVQKFESTRGPRENPQTTITPTFLLKGVDPLKVLNDYLTGNHPTSRKPSASCTPSTLISLIPKYGTTPDSETYVYRDRTNYQKRIVTTNHDVFSQSDDPSTLPTVGKCMWCRRELEKSPVGIPTTVKWTPDLSSPSRRAGSLRFTVDGTYCTFECAYASLKYISPPIHLMRDPLYMDSEQLLRLMYSTCYPDSKKFIQPAPDWRLLKDNGGPLTLQEFFSDCHRYVKTPNVVVHPIKIEFEAQRR